MYFILLFIYLCTILNIVSCTQNFHVYSPLHPCRNTKCAYTDINLSIFIYEPNQISHIITESDFQFFCFILSLSVKYRTPSVVICVFMRLFHVFAVVAHGIELRMIALQASLHSMNHILLQPYSLFLLYKNIKKARKHNVSGHSLLNLYNTLCCHSICNL